MHRVCCAVLLLTSCALRNSPSDRREFDVRGVITEIHSDSIVVRHEAIPGYMKAMTMPFNVKDRSMLRSLKVGDAIKFRLIVTGSESWVENIEKTGSSSAAPALPQASAMPGNPVHPLREYKFTNELGQPVALTDFKGQALAITFFFTRCPIPDFCPRLSRNFQEVQAKLASDANAPTNWHLLSVTIDPENDTPEVLRKYGERYQYDPQHWSFLTGPKDKIAEFAALSDVNYKWEGGSLNHSFRTIVIDPQGALQMVFPIGGNIADSIADEILKVLRTPNSSAGGGSIQPVKR